MGTYGAYRNRKAYIYFNPEIRAGKGKGWKKFEGRLPKAQIILLVQKAMNVKEQKHPRVSVKPRKGEK